MKASLKTLLLSGLVFQASAAFAQEVVQEEAAGEQAAPEAAPAAGSPLDILLPLKPGEILEAAQRKNAVDKAITMPFEAPSNDNRTIVIEVDPAASTSEVFIAQDYGSSITVLDVTGALWPIKGVIPGSANQIAVQQLGTGKFYINQLSQFVRTNVTVVLEGDNAPDFTFRVSNKPGVVNERLTLQVASRGPNAVMPVITSNASMSMMSASVTSDESYFMGFLDGNLPEGARALAVVAESGLPSDVRAWSFDGAYWVRSASDLLAAGILGSTRGANRVSVWKINPTPAVVMSEDGRLETYRLRAE